jgi:alpha-D-ribose 1-methylphosphonate 5-triphosphate synthase subunit PhnG
VVRNAPTENRSGEGARDARLQASHGIWTIQLAAYNTRSDAEALVASSPHAGVKARISGDAKPFRVGSTTTTRATKRVTRVAELKERGIIGS